MTELINAWKELLPPEYRKSVVRPTYFKCYSEPSVNAKKVIGLDLRGNNCFYYHTFVVTEEGFDVDEFPILIDVYYERVVAWRLRHGPWVRIKSYSDRMGRCGKPMTTLPAELTDTEPR